MANGQAEAKEDWQPQPRLRPQPRPRPEHINEVSALALSGSSSSCSTVFQLQPQNLLMRSNWRRQLHEQMEQQPQPWLSDVCGCVPLSFTLLLSLSLSCLSVCGFLNYLHGPHANGQVVWLTACCLMPCLVCLACLPPACLAGELCLSGQALVRWSAHSVIHMYVLLPHKLLPTAAAPPVASNWMWPRRPTTNDQRRRRHKCSASLCL